MNLSFYEISFFLTSGSAQISYLFGGNFASLKSKSPSARDKFKFPLTLPSITVPPASKILNFSNSKSGL